jgi:hypothetical protein
MKTTMMMMMMMMILEKSLSEDVVFLSLFLVFDAKGGEDVLPSSSMFYLFSFFYLSNCIVRLSVLV